MSVELNKKNKKMKEASFNLLVPARHQDPSVSILQSRQQIEEIDNIIKQIYAKEQFYKPNYINRQITAGLIVDWKSFQSKHAKGQLIVKDGDDSQKTVFSYLVLSQESNGQPKKVIYRWIKRFSKKEGEVCLQEQQHIYRGGMKNKKKHGESEYIILRRFSDNAKYQQLIKGIWNQDILVSGKMIDNLGNQKCILDSSISLRSKRQIGPVEQNRSIRLETHKLSTKFLNNSPVLTEIHTEAAHQILRNLNDHKKLQSP